MKQNIHPKYYPETKVKCACGEKFTVGSTKPEIKIEICSKCHPFYTGREQLIDAAGRVERFKTRQTKAQPARPKKVKAKKQKSKE
ncbi:MAG: 50S ribosomal protein L31 [Patescibacteria group bacterium]|nr:50S ribosomal protein L31 [Patescibacteria group bacterium]